MKRDWKSDEGERGIRAGRGIAAGLLAPCRAQFNGNILPPKHVVNIFSISFPEKLGSLMGNAYFY
jgi:hypothetical protein